MKLKEIIGSRALVLVGDLAEPAAKMLAKIGKSEAEILIAPADCLRLSSPVFSAIMQDKIDALIVTGVDFCGHERPALKSLLNRCLDIPLGPWLSFTQATPSFDIILCTGDKPFIPVPESTEGVLVLRHDGSKPNGHAQINLESGTYGFSAAERLIDEQAMTDTTNIAGLELAKALLEEAKKEFLKGAHYHGSMLCLMDQEAADDYTAAIAAITGAAAELRTEHAQRVTLQHHAADMAQRVADLEAERDKAHQDAVRAASERDERQIKALAADLTSFSEIVDGLERDLRRALGI